MSKLPLEAELQTEFLSSCFNETTNAYNKRYIVYSEVLRRSFYKTQSVLGNKDKSAIFVIPNLFLTHKESIIKEYEQIFSETN